MLDLPPGSGWLGVLTIAFDHHDGREMARVLETPPGRHVGHRVGPEQQEELSTGSAQHLERVGGDRRTVALDFDRTLLEPVDVLHRGADQREPVFGGGSDLLPLLPRVAGDDQQHPVEAERGSGVGRGDEVPDVHRVERPAKNAQTFLRGHHIKHTDRVPGECSPGRHTFATRATYPAPMDDDSTHVLIRIWLPDRPGALGLVAARIGALGGDIVGIDVLERSQGVAVDEFAVALPSLAVLDLLAREIEQVDGTSVEEFRVVGSFPDPRLDALDAATRLCETDSVEALRDTLVGHLRQEFLADWVALLGGDGVIAAAGDTYPATEFLSVLAAGTSASPMVADGTTGPEDLLVAALPTHAATLLVGRDGHPFRRRERAQLVALARIADRAWTLLER